MLSRRPLKIGLINIRSIRNKLCFVSETLQEHDLDLLCITETWLLCCDAAIVGASLPGSYSFLHVPRLAATKGGGVVLIYCKALSSMKIVGNQIEVSSFEIMEVSFSLCLQTFKLAVVYRPGHPGTDRTFMNEFGMFLEDVSRHEKLLLCGDFNYWLDTRASKPYTEEFLGLLNANNIKNFVMMPTHVSGHTLDLVLAPTESDFVGGIEISPIDSDISDHALLTFTLCFSRPPTYRKTITFRNYIGLDANVAANIETDLVDAVAQGQTSVQHTNSYNEVLSSARDQFCPLVTKDIIIKDDAPWYDHRMVTLRRQRRKAEREWRRLRTGSSLTVYVGARRAVVKQIFVYKVEYYQHQLALTTGDHRRTFQLLNDLLGKVQCSTMPSSSSEVELAARFSAFFNTKIDRIRSENDVSVAGHEFSVDISFNLDIASTFSYFRPINELMS